MKLQAKKLIFPGLVISLAVFIALTFTYVLYSQPKRSGEIKLTGLKDKVTVYFDKHGRPHVYANNLRDLVFTQCYLIAQDRLFQLDITRRAAKGELAEILGKKGLVRDKFTQDIGLLRISQKEYSKAGKQTREILNSYCKGINSYIRKNRHELPIEFRALNYKPKPWKPVDTLLIVKQIAEVTDTSWQLDLIRQEIFQKIPTERAEELFEQNFPGNPTINYDAKKYLVFDEYNLKKPNLLQKWKNTGQKIAIKKIIQAPYFKIRKAIIEAADFLRNGSDRWEGFNWGSNCWVIGNQKNKLPILANDPHMELANPTFWYPVHLVDKSTKTDFLGLSIPGIPGILIGHNGKVAWGITSLSADVQDLFVGEFKNRNSMYYKVNNKWEKARVMKSKIKVKNQLKPYTHTTVLTRCGPVLDRKGNKAVALKWSINDITNHDSVSAIWDLGKAKSWNGFRNTLRKYNGSTLSFHYIDNKGNIGYQAAGIIPNRAAGIGNTPIGGFSCSEHWKGNIPFEKLPHAYNPKVGYLVSANNKIVSHDFTHNLGNNFLSPFRAVRISTLLSRSSNNLDLASNKEMQKDSYSWVANYITIQILEAYYKSKMTNLDLLPVVQLLNKWDFKLDASSPQALIFEKTYENLLKNILINKLGPELTKSYMKEWRANSLALLRILINENKFWLPAGIRNYETLLLISLEDAVREIKQITKTDDPSKWIWGNYHTLTIEHPFSKVLPFLSPVTNVGPLKVGGDRDTISAFGTNNNLKVVWGPSARVVIDLNNPDSAHFQLPLGTSAQFGSRYYKDQTKDWLENTGDPFSFIENTIIKNKKDILVLNPKNKTK